MALNHNINTLDETAVHYFTINYSLFEIHPKLHGNPGTVQSIHRDSLLPQSRYPAKLFKFGN